MALALTRLSRTCSNPHYSGRLLLKLSVCACSQNADQLLAREAQDSSLIVECEIRYADIAFMRFRTTQNTVG